jgi:hypothetical protein
MALSPEPAVKSLLRSFPVTTAELSSTDPNELDAIASGMMLGLYKGIIKRLIWASVRVVLALSFVAHPVPAQQPLTIERLIADGWELVGYVSAWENRSLILFKHRDRKYLVQCSVLIDVTRAQTVVINCYELR